MPDLILLKANQNYLDFLDEPYNEMRNSIGKRQKDIVTGYEGSEGEELWNTMINGMKPYYTEEFQYNHYKRGVTYWNTSTMPIFINGSMKYIIQVTLDVTEKVLIRKSIEVRNQELEAIIENVSDGYLLWIKIIITTYTIKMQGSLFIGTIQTIKIRIHLKM